MVYTLAVVNAVRKYPCLWNKTDSDYKNVQVRKDAWLDICRSIYKDFDTNPDLMTKKMTTVQRKWRSSRDYFVKRQKSKQYNSSKYLRALSFLASTNTITKIEAVEQTNVDGDDESQYFDREDENFEDNDNSNEVNDKNEVTLVKIEDPVMISASNHSDYGHVKPFDSLEDFDANKSFAMSLIKEMNGMTEQQNFQFRMEVMKALNTVKYKLPEYSKLNED